jgi:hypothetical protein
MKSAIRRQPVENCCLGDTGDLLLRCGKLLKHNEKRPKSADLDASRPNIICAGDVLTCA